MNAKLLTASALAATMTFGAVAPALADGAASTRNILLGGAAAAVLDHELQPQEARQSAKQDREQARRQASYRSYFYHRYGYYPSEQQYHDWYYRTYGVQPSN